MWLIRQMRNGDIHKVQDIWLTVSIREYAFVAEHLRQDPAEYWRSRLERMTDDTRLADGYVYESDGRVVGFMTLNPAKQYILELFVDSASQGKGAGTALIKVAKSLHPYLYTHVYREKVPALRFYERQGFLCYGTHPEESTDQIKLVMKWKADFTV